MKPAFMSSLFSYSNASVTGRLAQVLFSCPRFPDYFMPGKQKVFGNFFPWILDVFVTLQILLNFIYGACKFHGN